jgi:hypothetical protein
VLPREESGAQSPISLATTLQAAKPGWVSVGDHVSSIAPRGRPAPRTMLVHERALGLGPREEVLQKRHNGRAFEVGIGLAVPDCVEVSTSLSLTAGVLLAQGHDDIFALVH